jgi:hypothetical protein
MTHTRQLLETLGRLNFDDRSVKLGKRNRDKAGAALEQIGRKTHDPMIIRFAMAKLPKHESIL